MNKLMMAFIVSAAFAYAATPIAKCWAEKVGAIDIPKRQQRIHKKPTPLLGGLAIYLPFDGNYPVCPFK